jgi:hypothetical protein
MDHFIHEKYGFRLLCIRYLASRGWRWFGEESLLDPVPEPPWFTSGVLANSRQPTAALDAEQGRFMRAVPRSAPGLRWSGFDADSSTAITWRSRTAQAPTKPCGPRWPFADESWSRGSRRSGAPVPASGWR